MIAAVIFSQLLGFNARQASSLLLLDHQYASYTHRYIEALVVAGASQTEISWLNFMGKPYSKFIYYLYSYIFIICFSHCSDHSMFKEHSDWVEALVVADTSQAQG